MLPHRRAAIELLRRLQAVHFIVGVTLSQSEPGQGDGLREQVAVVGRRSVVIVQLQDTGIGTRRAEANLRELQTRVEVAVLPQAIAQLQRLDCACGGVLQAICRIRRGSARVVMTITDRWLAF